MDNKRECSNCFTELSDSENICAKCGVDNSEKSLNDKAREDFENKKTAIAKKVRILYQIIAGIIMLIIIFLNVDLNDSIFKILFSWAMLIGIVVGLVFIFICEVILTMNLVKKKFVEPNNDDKTIDTENKQD